jgi:glycosyltransferase involved in cell wall biosynthesis
MTPIRVGFWLPMLGCQGGTETWHRMLISGLQKDPSFQITGIAILDPEETDKTSAEEFTRSGVKVYYDRFGMNFLAAGSDIIVSWGISDPPTYALDHCYHVMVAHGDDAFPWLTAANYDASPLVHQFVCVSKAALRAIPENRREEATIIPNGVDLEFIGNPFSHQQRENMRQEWGVSHFSKVVGMVCRISEEKDPEGLARAIAHLPSEWCGVMIGDGPEMVRTRAHAFSMTTRVFFPGRTDNVVSALAGLDFYLSTSLSEGFGFANVEAIGAMLPTACTPVGILEDEEYLCPDIIVHRHATGQVLADSILEVWDRRGTRAARIIKQATIRTLLSSQSFVNNWATYLRSLPCKAKQAL